MRFVQRNAGRTAVLLLHGNSSCKEIFRNQIDALVSTDLSIVVPDLPGHGGSDNSPTPSRTYSFPGYADILTELMRELAYPAFHVVGWSLGGHIGLEMWSRDQSVKSLLISGTPPVRLDALGIAAGFRWTATTALAGRKRFGREDVTRYLRAMMGHANDPGGHFAAMVARTDGNARSWMVKNAFAGVGTDELRSVAEISRPLAIVQGRDDPFLRDGYLKNIPFKNLWTGAPVMINSGHAPHWQIPRTFNARMTEFLMQTN